MKQKAMEWKRVALEATRAKRFINHEFRQVSARSAFVTKPYIKGSSGLNIVKLARKIVREKEKEMGSISKPHVVVIPSPVQGHIKTMLKFAKLLHYKGLHITFVNTEFNHNRLLRSGGLHAVDDLPGFHFDTIPDGLPPSDIDATQDIPSLCDAMNKKFLAPFTDLLLKLKNTVSENNPPITCVVADPFAPFSIKAGEEVGLPVVMYATVNACGYMGCKQLYALREKGFTPIKDLSNLSNDYLETKVDCAPGMKDVRLKDFPFIQTTDPDEVVFNFVIGAAETSVKARAIALHTFDALEPEVLDGLSTIFPRVYSIGPLQLLLNQIEENGLKSIGYNLWKEDRSCLQWLDTKEPKSVVYVNFGSITVMTAAQLVEFAMGLANSKISFLWIIRPDLVTGESAVLPAEFAETENRSFITSWCPQEEVLNHPAVGGFLTHSGWGSTIESLCAGVPMVCWPFFADQAMNCRYSCNEWGVGMEIDNNVKREGVEMLVKELMEGGEGEKMREKAMEWKRLAEEAAGPKGTSSINLDKFIHEIISSNNPVQGHIKTMLKFAKLLHYKCLHVTFVNTEFNHKRLLRSRGADALDDLPGFHFRTIPDGLPPSDLDATQDIPSLCDAMNKNFLAPFKDLLLKLKNTVSENNPPITCIVADPFAPFSIKAGEEVGLPVVMYAIVNACGYMGIKQLYALREKGFAPIRAIKQDIAAYISQEKTL
uniref:anthocyanidin 3-O-glucosyltransferase n=1 Tax=Salix viminalis TaxID=40686 RepID=A0A6N2MPC3_SALVM